jgi:hypothetical protein
METPIHEATWVMDSAAGTKDDDSIRLILPVRNGPPRTSRGRNWRTLGIQTKISNPGLSRARKRIIKNPTKSVVRGVLSFCTSKPDGIITTNQSWYGASIPVKQYSDSKEARKTVYDGYAHAIRHVALDSDGGYSLLSENNLDSYSLLHQPSRETLAKVSNIPTESIGWGSGCLWSPPACIDLQLYPLQPLEDSEQPICNGLESSIQHAHPGETYLDLCVNSVQLPNIQSDPSSMNQEALNAVESCSNLWRPDSLFGVGISSDELAHARFLSGLAI